VALRTGLSRPDSPSEASRLRLIAALIACRTGSWLVGHSVRFGIRALDEPAASQKWWFARSGATKSRLRFGM